MNLKRAILASAAGLGLLLSACQTTQGPNAAGVPGVLELHSGFPGRVPITGTQGRRFEREFNKQSTEDLTFKFVEPGVGFPILEGLDRAGSNPEIAIWTTPGSFFGREHAFAVFGGLPFSPPPREHLDWLQRGGGQALMDKLFARYNTKAVPCSYMDAEGFGWFHERIRTAADLRGLRMRFFGLGARVMGRAGATPMLLPGGEIYPALEDRKIDATEFSTPYIDAKMGFSKIAKTYYYPGWHQPLGLLTVILNLDTWNALTPGQKQRLEEVCAANIEAGLQESNRLLGPAIEEFRNDGVVVLRTPAPVEKRLRSLWEDYAAELGLEDPDFREAHESLIAFSAGI